MNTTIHTKLVSIAMATYNGEQFIEKQIESLLHQTYRPIEIIISDDGSTDNTLIIVEEYIKKYPFIFLFNNEKQHGIKKNFENALRNCNGKYIALSDQDDIWMPQKITTLVENIGTNALIYHNSMFVDNNNISLNNSIAQKLNCYSGSNPKAFLLFNCVSGHACMFDRKLIDISLPFPNAKFHDWWLAFVATQNGGVKYINQILVNYRQHENSKTDILSLKKSTVHRKEIDKYEEEIEWYESCANFKSSYQVFFKKWLSLYKKRKQQWFCFSLFFLARKNASILYTLRKKNDASIFFESLKLLWGFKLKKRIR
jgi:glycosyltransferase involved in cell wall biosynthesis